MIANQTDLFGQPLPPAPSKRQTQAGGYARPPGSGPGGEFCRTCVHACKIGYHDRGYHKCAIIRHRWTNGPGTDIVLKSPACSMWSKAP